LSNVVQSFACNVTEDCLREPRRRSASRGFGSGNQPDDQSDRIERQPSRKNRNLGEGRRILDRSRNISVERRKVSRL
jgi:hypothetical protein